jgi:hypothetical protein
VRPLEQLLLRNQKKKLKEQQLEEMMTKEEAGWVLKRLHWCNQQLKLVHN